MNEQNTHAEYSKSVWSGRGSLHQLVAELDRQKNATCDFVADTRNMAVDVRDGTAWLVPAQSASYGIREWIPCDGMPINHRAIGQLGERMAPSVPLRFLRKLIDERPEIASELLSSLLRETGSTNLVRCLDGRVRAFLSDRYQPLDNYSLAFQALDTARAHGGEIVECALSDTHMRIKLTSRAIFDALDTRRSEGDSGWYAGGLGDQKHLSKVAARTGGDLPGGPGTIHPLITIGNSETGHGSLFVRAGVLQAICFNLATVEDVVTNVHLGARLDPGIFSQTTMRKEAEAIMAKAGDAITTAFDKERFAAIVAKCRNAQGVMVNPTQAVDFAVTQGVVTEEQRDDLLAHFLGESAGALLGHNAYGFAQGLARFAQTLDDPDAASDVEDFAGRVIAKPAMVAATVSI